MRLGFQTLPWGRRIDDLDHTLAVIVACGYEGVEFGQSHVDIFVRDNGQSKPIGTFRRLKERLEKHNLKLIGFVGGSLEERMAFCGDDRDSYLYVDSWSPAWDKALLTENPFTLALHPHWLMQVRKLRHAEEYLEKYPGNHLKLIVDTAHATIAEDDPVAAATKHIKRLASVHLKDWKPDFGRWSHRYAHGFCLPGEGIILLEKTLEALHQQKFDGWVVMEQDYFEINREQTALACSQWASQFSGKYFRSFSPDVQTVEQLQGKKHSPLFQPSLDERIRQIQLVSQFTLAPVHSAETLYSNITHLVKQLYHAEAVKLWSYNPMTNEICLLSARLDGHLPQDTSVWNTPDKSLTGSVIYDPHVLIHDLWSDHVRSRFNDKDFLKALKTQWMITIPVFNSSNPHHLRYIITIFPSVDLLVKDNRISDRDRFELEHYADIISIWADYRTDEACSAAAGATNHLCGEVKQGVNKFVDALMDHIGKRLNCENVTVWLLDESRTRLLPAGKTEERITWNPDLAKSERCYRIGEDFYTSRTWADREMLFSSHALADSQKIHKSRENPPKSTRRELLTAPLVRRGGEVLGVVRLHNKKPHNLGPASTMFTDDDAAKLDAIIQAALPHLDLLITQQRQAFALTRLAHELHNPLIGIVGAADFLREKLKEHKITDLKSEFGADYIDDIFCYKDLMSRLIQTTNLFGDTIAGLGEPNCQHTELATTVVMPVVKQLRPLLKQYRISEERIHVAQFQGTIPWLTVDRLMFQQVFFNLFVNAIKYHDGAENFRLEVKVSLEGNLKSPDFYVIEVEDDGIGLDEDEKTGDSLFLPGVRGANVTQFKDVTGMGVGLAVVWAVIIAHCGTVEFSSFHKPTRITIRLPGALRHMSPKMIRKMQASAL